MSQISQKIKIVFILPDLSSGGAERVTINLLQALDKNKFEPYLVCFKGGGYFFNQASKLAKVIIITKSFKLNPIKWWKFIRTIKKIKPDIIHSQLGVFYGVAAGKILGIKALVSTVHNVNIADNSITAKLQNWGFRHSTVVTAVSQAVKQDAVQRYGLNESKIRTILNGVNLSEFKPVKKKFDHHKIVLGAIGRLTEQKGFKLLIQALSLLKQDNYVCKIAGEGSLYDILDQQIKDLGLTSKVQLIGRQVANDFYASIDALIVPSLWEGLGVVVLEAGAMKLPIIASQADGLKEIIKDNYNGLSFPVNQLKQLANQIDWLLINYDSADVQRWRENIYQTVVERFSQEQMARAYEKIYNSLV